MLKVASFDPNTQENKLLREKLADEWVKKALNVFSQTEMRWLFGSLKSLKHNRTNTNAKNPIIEDILKERGKLETNKSGQPTCDCRWGWYCGGRCVSTPCLGTSYIIGGCGFMFIQTCEYVCVTDDGNQN
jgi:hypothetical protein